MRIAHHKDQTMSKISHGPNAVHMNLFATWEIDKSSPHCIPRVCTLALRRLNVMKELDKDVQSVFIAAKMQGSKRVLRSNEIVLPSNGLLNAELDLTFSLQYPHFIKREGNTLQIMLQRRKRYKNRAILGYKTLAIGQIDMAQIIQKPIVEESCLDLLSTNKERRSSVVVAAQTVIFTLVSTPVEEGDESSEQVVKQVGADRSPDADNYSDDDDETFSSDPDIGSDINPQELDEDEDDTRKRKERRKLRLTSSSRQQNFIKAKVIALLRRFKQVADEGLEPDLVPDAENGPDPVDLDFLYDDLEDLNLSDSCPEVEDNISLVSTPKPQLRPFFDRSSYSSSQTEISSLRDHHLSEQAYLAYSNPTEYNSSLYERNKPVRETFESLQHLDDMPAIDQSDTSDNDTAEQDYSLPGQPLAMGEGAQTNDHTGSEPDSPGPQSNLSSSQHLRKRSWPRSRSPSFPRSKQVSEKFKKEIQSSSEELESAVHRPSSFIVINGTFKLLEEGNLGTGSSSLPNCLLLINSLERCGKYLADSFQSSVQLYNALDITVLATNSLHQLHVVFNELITKLQKFINSNAQQPVRVKVGIAGSESYISLVLQLFVDLLSPRSPDWHTYFLFLPVPLGKHRLGQYISSLDPHYSKLFNDPFWRESFENTAKASTPTNPSVFPDHHSVSQLADKQQSSEKTIVRRVVEYMTEASAILPLSIAEAMLTFGENSDKEGCSQKFIPFISEAEVGENETTNQIDSDREDVNAGFSNSLNSSAGNPGQPNSSGALSLPTSPLATLNTTQSSGLSSIADLKIGLQVDYWKEKDSTKYSLKTTFRSFHVRRLSALGEHASSTGLALDVVTMGKKNIMRLPGKKGKEKDSDSKSQVINSVSRLICTSKHQHNLLKVKIDGIEWKEVKFFQLSSHWSSHVKIFQVGLFSTR